MNSTIRWFACALAAVVSSSGVQAYDDPSMKRRVAELWASENFQELEKIAEDCRKDRFDILDYFPRLEYFYATIRGSGVQSDADAKARLEKIDRWLNVVPGSVTARVVLADFRVTDAWRARENKVAEKVDPTAWPIFRQRLESARRALYAKGMTIKADPCIAGLRVVVEMGLEGTDASKLKTPWLEAAKWWPEYFPPSDNVARALLPRWGGAQKDAALFVEEAAKRFTGPKSDGFYAMLADRVLETEGMEAFPSMGFDFPRFVRGLDVLASRGDPIYRHFPRQRAAYIEAMLGDPAKARERIFATGPLTIPTAYSSPEWREAAWEKCGATEKLQQGIALEKAGRLEEAEALYQELSRENPNPWLASFALRNGITRLWPENYDTPAAGLPLAGAHPNQIFEMATRQMCAGNLESATDLAKAFDAVRSHNLTGKTFLVASAAFREDKDEFAAEKTRFLAMKTDRRGYQIAQDYAAGRMTWAEAREALPRDAYFSQSCAMMAAVALGEGHPTEAREISLGVHHAMPFQEAAAFAESMLWGALYRKFPARLGE